MERGMKGEGEGGKDRERKERIERGRKGEGGKKRERKERRGRGRKGRWS